MKTFLKIYLFFLTFILAVGIGRSFLSLWYIQNNFTFPQISLYFLIDFAIPPIILLLVKKFSTARSFAIALISEILLMLNVYHFYHPVQIYLAGALAGTTVVFFYLTYNILFFENTPKDKRASSASSYILAGPFFNLIIPLIVGFVGQSWGLQNVFLVAIFILLIVFWMVRFLPKIEFECHLWENLKETGRINSLLLIEGIKDAIPLAAIPLFTLFFIRQPLPYGVYFSYMAFVSIATTFLLSLLSDKFKKRTIFLYPITSLVALTIIVLAFSQNLIWWALVSGTLSLLLTLNGTFVTTLVLDQTAEVKTGMISREFLLGAGRVIGVFIIFASLVLSNSPKTALILIGSLYFLFPLTLWLKRIY